MKVLLVKHVELPVGGKVIPAGTMIYIDVASNVGFWDDHHFDIDPEEYAVIH